MDLINTIRDFIESEAGDKMVLLLLILYFGISAFYMNIDFYYRLIDTLVGAMIMKIRGGGSKEKLIEIEKITEKNLTP